MSESCTCPTTTRWVVQSASETVVYTILGCVRVHQVGEWGPMHLYVMIFLAQTSLNYADYTIHAFSFFCTLSNHQNIICTLLCKANMAASNLLLTQNPHTLPLSCHRLLLPNFYHEISFWWMWSLLLGVLTYSRKWSLRLTLFRTDKCCPKIEGASWVCFENNKNDQIEAWFQNAGSMGWKLWMAIIIKTCSFLVDVKPVFLSWYFINGGHNVLN